MSDKVTTVTLAARRGIQNSRRGRGSTPVRKVVDGCLTFEVSSAEFWRAFRVTVEEINMDDVEPQSWEFGTLD